MRLASGSGWRIAIAQIVQVALSESCSADGTCMPPPVLGRTSGNRGGPEGRPLRGASGDLNGLPDRPEGGRGLGGVDDSNIDQST